MNDPVCGDVEDIECRAFERLKAELSEAFAAPESAYKTLDPDAVIARNGAQKAE